MLTKTNAHEFRDLGPSEWVTHYADYLYRYARMRISDDDLARDLVQETFLTGLEGWGRFDKRSSEKTWLTAILRNKIFDVYRKKSKQLPNQDVNSSSFLGEDFFEESGHWKQEYYPQALRVEEDKTLESEEFVKVLASCMDKLPPLWKSVFIMKHVDEESSRDICEQLHITDSNFWVISHRTKLNLRNCLQKNWL